MTSIILDKMRLTTSSRIVTVSELSGFTCMGSLTMNEKFSIPYEAVECGFVNFEFIVSVYYSN